MFLSLIFMFINTILALTETYAIRLRSFDLSPVLIMIAAQQNENVLLAALLINLPYTVLNPQKLRFLWATLPASIICGYLALLIPNLFIVVLLYHALLAIVALFSGALGAGYMLFVAVNLAANLAVARFA